MEREIAVFDTPPFIIVQYPDVKFTTNNRTASNFSFVYPTAMYIAFFDLLTIVHLPPINETILIMHAHVHT